ncbi:WD domain, G-beta repeat-containing protein [Cryptosporidium felis]|nr:WD domain, G-beta repeat-containing protein [Cryptosporidium felis]
MTDFSKSDIGDCLESYGIFSLPEVDRLLGDSVGLASNGMFGGLARICKNERVAENSRLSREICDSILETESILNRIFNTDNFSVVESSISEVNEERMGFQDSHQIEVQKGKIASENSSVPDFQEIKSDKNLPSEGRSGVSCNDSEEMNIKEMGQNPKVPTLEDPGQHSASSGPDSLDEYTTFDYGFDGSGLISSMDDWESDDNSFDLKFGEMDWPEAALDEEGELESELGTGERMEAGNYDDITKDENEDFLTEKGPSREDAENNTEFDSVGPSMGSGRENHAMGMAIIRRPGSESSYNKLEVSTKHVPSMEEELTEEKVAGLKASPSPEKLKRWLPSAPGSSKIQSYLGIFKGDHADGGYRPIGSNTFKHIFRGSGVFRKTGCLSNYSFNSSLLTSLGNAINKDEKISSRQTGEDYLQGGHQIRAFPTGNQEGRKSLRQRNLPIRISTKYQICNKTRRIRENDIGVVWLIREIYLSLTPQILKLSISMDGEWLILGSQDGAIRQWRFREEDLREHSMLLSSSSQMEPFFNEKEELLIEAHSNAIISLQWENDEKSHRFLSSSMDRTVKLWEAGNKEPKAAVSCSDWPTSVSFHPVQKNIIFIGSLDASVQILRLVPIQNSTEKYHTRVIETVRVQDLLTSLSVSPNGKYLACGFKDGGVAFYDARTLKYRCDVDCRNRRGKSSKGRKVSGISWKKDNKSVLVTTNDSRVRLFNLSDLSTFVKFKGHINEETLLSAQISNDEKFIVSGSENGYICFWDIRYDCGRLLSCIQNGGNYSQGSGLQHSLGNSQVPLRYDRSNIRRGPTQHCLDSFKAFDSSLTSTILAPPSFSRKIIKFFKINHRNSPNYPSFSTYTNEKNAHIFIAVNRNGQIRIFMNIPN